jgi:dienelactone hydrolase
MHKKNKRTILVLSLICVGILIFVSLFFMVRGDKSRFDESTNKMIYPKDRSPPRYTISELTQNDNYTTYKIIYKSEDFLEQEGKIYALLYMPRNHTQESNGLFAGIVSLPGGGVKKEDDPLSPILANMGYAVLVIDQRGIGETDGFYPNYDQDRTIFNSEKSNVQKSSIQHLGVYDALLAIDVLKNIDEVDKNRIAIAGASMGGRYAMIAATMDENIKGALIISSAGFHIEETNLYKDSYFLSIDPDRYIKDITPAKLVMLHGINDSIINIKDAAKTYTLANGPKAFYAINTSVHGYSSDMRPIIEEELKGMLG